MNGSRLKKRNILQQMKKVLISFHINIVYHNQLTEITVTLVKMTS